MIFAFHITLNIILNGIPNRGTVGKKSLKMLNGQSEAVNK